MEYILDYSKWRSGSDGLWKVGIGGTRMLNKEGYSCCLGQFAKQVGVGDDFLFDWSTPLTVSYSIGLYDNNFVGVDGAGGYYHTDLAYSLITINDTMEKQTPGERINAIRNKLEEHGHTLKVINAPDGIK